MTNRRVGRDALQPRHAALLLRHYEVRTRRAGRIDLVHCKDSCDGFDCHTNLRTGEIVTTDLAQ